MLKDIFITAFQLSKKYMNLMQPFLLFLIILLLFMGNVAAAKSGIVNNIILMILFFFLVVVFMAGWSNAFKAAIEYDKINELKTPEEREYIPPLFLGDFAEGVGKYFFKFAGAGVFYMILALIFALGMYYIATNMIGIPEAFSKVNLSQITHSEAAFKTFFFSLSDADRLRLAKINLLGFIAAGLFSYLTMLIPVSLVMGRKNFFADILTSIKLLFKKFFVSLNLFLFFNILLFSASVINAAGANNVILSIIGLLLFCFINLYYFMTLFIYYEKAR
ncbi:MAG: hypothetical protein PHX18_07915 [Candidatus Gastranaerophilales bacterium]|nr:hypothetical protein [Candidatus Gastranaerophilales bacterium]